MTTLDDTQALDTAATTLDDGPLVVGIDTAIGSKDSSGTGIASSRGWVEAVGYPDRKKKGREFSKLPHPERLAHMRQLAHRIILAVGQPDLAVLEAPSLRSMGGGAHERAWLWWEVYRRLTDQDIPVGLLAPSLRMAYATGKGQVGKPVVVDAVARRWPQWQTEGDDNLADAVVLMAAGRDWLGAPIAPMPKPNRAALDKATWPERVAS